MVSGRQFAADDAAAQHVGDLEIGRLALADVFGHGERKLAIYGLVSIPGRNTLRVAIRFELGLGGRRVGL